MKDYGFIFDDTYTSLPESFYRVLNPTPVTSPQMVLLNQDLADSIGLNLTGLNNIKKANLFTGNHLPNNCKPYAQAYAGHQFGHFTILGDGRAIVLGEHLTPDQKRLDIQFKGSGRTPYSRGGDGRAALGPMLREYIISEAMHSLHIPTTRSLAVATTGESIMRNTPLPGAILTRIASSHIRIGTFEFAAAQDDKEAIQSLMDYTIMRHYPELLDSDNKAIELLNIIIEKQSDLIVNWMRVGFIHGVMNTDNMTLSGETIDYGPCAFMDQYNPDTVFSSIDHAGRYAYANQPKIAQWNIARLAEALLPLINSNIEEAIEIAQDTINKFTAIYQNKWLSMMRTKIGLLDKQSEDENLILDLLKWMQTNNADFTNTFRDLSQEIKLFKEIYQQSNFNEWYTKWQKRLTQSNYPIESAFNTMKEVNPSIIPRNHKVEEALEAATNNNLTPLHSLLNAMKNPYEDNDSLIDYQSPSNNHQYQTFCGT